MHAVQLRSQVRCIVGPVHQRAIIEFLLDFGHGSNVANFSQTPVLSFNITWSLDSNKTSPYLTDGSAVK